MAAALLLLAAAGCNGRIISPGSYEAGKVAALEFSPDGGWLVAARQSGIVEAWPIAGSEPGEPSRWRVGGSVNQIRFAREAGLVGLGGYESVELRDLKSQKTKRRWERVSGAGGLGFSADGSELYACGPWANVVHVLDVRGGGVLRTIVPDGEVTCLDVDPKGRWLATREGWSIVIRDPRGSVQRVLETSTHIDRSLRFDPTGRWLAWIRDSSFVVVWDTQTWKPAAQTAPHGLESEMNMPGGALAFDGLGKRLFTGTGEDDCAILVWDVATGAARGRLGRHEGAVLALACNPARPMLASGSGPRKEVFFPPNEFYSVKLWHIP